MAAQTENFVIGDAAFAVRQSGEIVLWNSEAEKLLGYPATCALGSKCWKLLAGKDIYGNRYCSEFCALREMALKHESVHSFPIFFKTSSDGQKKFLTSSLEIYDKPGNGLLLHICHTPDEDSEPANHGHENNHHSFNNHRGALTPRELDVLALLADGQSTAEIASTMCISQATVRNHIHHILTKMHVHNRLEAILMGQRIDLI